MIWHVLWMFWTMSSGCTIKSGIEVAQAQKTYNSLEATDAKKTAPYEWTMTHAYMRKAREEYASGEYQRAEELSGEVVKWAEKAMEIASPIQEIEEEAVEEEAVEEASPPSEEEAGNGELP